ncbi:unnamed protein product, partial [Effrenium voratum]
KILIACQAPRASAVDGWSKSFQQESHPIGQCGADPRTHRSELEEIHGGGQATRAGTPNRVRGAGPRRAPAGATDGGLVQGRSRGRGRRFRGRLSWLRRLWPAKGAPGVPGAAKGHGGRPGGLQPGLPVLRPAPGEAHVQGPERRGDLFQQAARSS